MHTMLSDKELIGLLQHQFELRNATVSNLQQVMTELTEANQKLIESEQLKSQFLSNIRNEINNPLASIIGAAANLQSMGADPSVRQLADIIYKESQNLNFQLENIFIAAELEAGAISPVIRPLHLDPLVLGVINTFHSAAAEKNLRVDLQRNPENISEIPFYSDTHMVRVALSNILHNAIKFSETNRTVHITLCVTEHELSIAVMDQGIGIAKEHQSIVFDRFRQVDAGSRKEHEGHGLGLSIAQALLDQLQGVIQIESALRQGATFTIRIPNHPPGGGGDSPESDLLFEGSPDIETF